MAAHSLLKLIANHDGTPVPLDQLSAPLLKDFAARESVLTEWHDFIEQILDGNRNWVPIGLPWVRWTFFRLSRAEFAYLATLSGDVTITTLNQSGNAYHTYNGTWKPIEPNSSNAKWAADAINGWEDVAFEIYDLEVLG